MKRTDEGFEHFIIPGIGFNDEEDLSRNSASSRAIPFKKMVQTVMKDPFVPIAWQADHTGMQGSKYLDPTRTYTFLEFREVLQKTFGEIFGEVDGFDWYQHTESLHFGRVLTLEGWWLKVRDLVVEVAILLHAFGLTKQLCNRLLEPFMWHTVLVTATELENFFHLRCPQYVIPVDMNQTVYRSRKDLSKAVNGWWSAHMEKPTELEWLSINKGQAEIHMMALAEAMWVAMNESTPVKLNPGEWHMPFIRDEIGRPPLTDKEYLKLAVAYAARTSYTVVGEEGKPRDYKKDIELHDRLLESGHMSPFEHCAQAMTEEEFTRNIKGYVDGFTENDGDVGIHERYRIFDGQKTKLYNDDMFGWCHNLRGWKSYRSMIPNENRR